MTPGRRVTGSVEADNGGSRYTGEYRGGATADINNLLGRGDVAGFRPLTSGHGLVYGRASYQAQFGKATVGVAYTALEYHLGKEFAPLQAHGTAQIASIWGSYPLIRSRNTNLYALIGFDARAYEDKVDSTAPPTVTDKRAHVWIGSLYGNHRDRLGAGGVSSFSLTYSAGDLDIRTPAALAIDAATARTDGNYGKLALAPRDCTKHHGPLLTYAGIYGQFASNTWTSRKRWAGGPYAVRAYPVVKPMRRGYVVNLERDTALPSFPSACGQFYLIGFVDTGG